MEFTEKFGGVKLMEFQKKLLRTIEILRENFTPAFTKMAGKMQTMKILEAYHKEKNRGA